MAENQISKKESHFFKNVDHIIKVTQREAV